MVCPNLDTKENIFEEFDALIPSTITIVGKMSHPIDREKAFYNLPIIENYTLSEENNIPRTKKPKFPLIDEIGIISIRLFDDKFTTEEIKHRTDAETENQEDTEVTNRISEEVEDQVSGVVRYFDKKVSWRCRGMKGNRPFSTSLALDFSLGAKNISFKFFENGSVQFTGCQSLMMSNLLIDQFLELFKECGAIDEDASILWVDPQAIHYRYRIGFKILFVSLGNILKHYSLIDGHDTLLQSKIDIISKSSISQAHLKSRKQRSNTISIYESGKIVQKGSDLEEIKNQYNILTKILTAHSEEIKQVLSSKKMSNKELIKEYFLTNKNAELTPQQVAKEFGILKKESNAALFALWKEQTIKRRQTPEGTNPRYSFRKKGEESTINEEKEESPNKPNINEEDVIYWLNEYDDLRAGEIARFHFNLDSEREANQLQISTINSILYKLEANSRVKKFTDSSSAKPRWVLK